MHPHRGAAHASVCRRTAKPREGGGEGPAAAPKRTWEDTWRPPTHSRGAESRATSFIRWSCYEGGLAEGGPWSTRGIAAQGGG